MAGNIHAGRMYGAFGVEHPDMIAMMYPTCAKCAKCGCDTRGEAALVGDQIWCHPCADAVEQNDWKLNCLSALKLLHEALDVIEAIDSECLLPGQLKDMVDIALAPRRNA